MLIYGVSGIFAHKKTIKQFLQPMIEQIWEGEMCLEDVPQFSRATVFFVSVFFNSQMSFWGLFYQYLHIFLYIMAILHQKNQTVFWAQTFRDVRLIPNFLRYPACL